MLYSRERNEELDSQCRSSSGCRSPLRSCQAESVRQRLPYSLALSSLFFSPLASSARPNAVAAVLTSHSHLALALTVHFLLTAGPERAVMPAVEAEDALMAELFADLDASCFTSPPSSQTLPASQGSRARPVHPSKRVKLGTPSPRPQTRANRLPRPVPSSKFAPSSQPTQPAPFWDNPFAHPPLTQQSLAERDRRERAIEVAPSLPRDAGRKVVGRVRANQDSLADQAVNAGMKRGREARDVGNGRAVKHVAVEIEGKENADVLRRGPLRERKPLVVEEEEVKPVLSAPTEEKPVVDDFADMLEDVDWDKEMLAFDDEAKAVHEDVSRDSIIT